MNIKECIEQKIDTKQVLTQSYIALVKAVGTCEYYVPASININDDIKKFPLTMDDIDITYESTNINKKHTLGQIKLDVYYPIGSTAVLNGYVCTIQQYEQPTKNLFGNGLYYVTIHVKYESECPNNIPIHNEYAENIILNSVNSIINGINNLNKEVKYYKKNPIDAVNLLNPTFNDIIHGQILSIEKNYIERFYRYRLLKDDSFMRLHMTSPTITFLDNKYNAAAFILRLFIAACDCDYANTAIMNNFPLFNSNEIYYPECKKILIVNNANIFPECESTDVIEICIVIANRELTIYFTRDFKYFTFSYHTNDSEGNVLNYYNMKNICIADAKTEYLRSVPEAYIGHILCVLQAGDNGDNIGDAIDKRIKFIEEYLAENIDKFLDIGIHLPYCK